MSINEPYVGNGAPLKMNTSILTQATEFYFWGILFVNIWPISWIFRREKERVLTFSWINVLNNWAFYFYLLDVFSLLMCPILLNLPQEVYQMQHIIVILTIVPCGFVYFYLINAYYFTNYDPNKYGSDLIFFNSYVEFNHSPKICSIRVSEPFRIVLENDGYEPILKGTIFYIERTVLWRADGTPGRNRNPFASRIRFPLKFEEELSIGQFVVMIPETHNEPGAVRVPDYRSFGNAKGALVTTCVYTDRERLVTKYTEEFKRLCDAIS